MAFSQSIFDKKEEFYKRFALEFFDEGYWLKIQTNDNDMIDAFICAFYTTIKTRCELGDIETSEIVYKSMKAKCKKMPSYNEFKIVLDKKISKTGFTSFFNSDIKKGMKAFESLYLQWELKMLDEGYVENY